jgi:hypothetical protein
MAQEDEMRLSLADWVIIGGGGAIGGHLGTLLVAAVLGFDILPGMLDPMIFLCWGTGVATGILPGLAALDMMAGKKGRRWAGLLLALASGAWFTMALASLAAVSASC